MAFSAAPPNDELLASALEDSAHLEPLPLSHDASVNGTAMASMMRAAGCSDAGDAGDHGSPRLQALAREQGRPSSGHHARGLSVEW